jgi:hypothetical protein
VGEFVAATAVRVAAVEAVAGAVVRYAAGHGLGAEPIDPADRDDVTTVDLWAPRGGWTVLSWPRFFGGNAAVGSWLSHELDALVSAIDVYDGDFWNHVAWRGGAEVDRFSSCPDYFTKDRRRITRLKQEWAGRPDVLATAFGVSPDRVAPYLLHPFSSGFFGRRLAGRHPLPGDRFLLADVWVFVDFWARLGITYPDTDDRPVRSVRFAGDGPSGLPTAGPAL